MGQANTLYFFLSLKLAWTFHSLHRSADFDYTHHFKHVPHRCLEHVGEFIIINIRHVADSLLNRTFLYSFSHYDTKGSQHPLLSGNFWILSNPYHEQITFRRQNHHTPTGLLLLNFWSLVTWPSFLPTSSISTNQDANFTQQLSNIGRWLIRITLQHRLC